MTAGFDPTTLSGGLAQVVCRQAANVMAQYASLLRPTALRHPEVRAKRASKDKARSQ